MQVAELVLYYNIGCGYNIQQLFFFISSFEFPDYNWTSQKYVDISYFIQFMRLC